MAKIKLGARPKAFAKALTFPMHDGTQGSIEVQFRYRTRTEFGAFVEGILDAQRVKAKSEEAAREAKRKSAKEAGEEDPPENFSAAELHKGQAEANADYIMQIVDGWNLDEPFTRESVLQLCDELPAAAVEIINSYRAAIVEGRLGN